MGQRGWAAILVLVCGACAGRQVATPPLASVPPAPRSPGYEVREAVSEAPDPDGIVVQLEQGYLPREEVEAAIERRWSTLVRCYDEAGDARQFAGGEVKLRFVVDRRGQSVDVLVVESRLGNLAVERCLMAMGRTIAFPSPQGGGTSFEYTLEFRSTGERPVVDLPDGEVAAHLPSLLPLLEPDCQRLGAASLQATLYVESRGAVRSVGFSTAATVAPEAVECLFSAITRWTVPLEGLRGRSLGRATLALRSSDLVAPPEPERRPTRLTHGRRPTRGSSARR